MKRKILQFICGLILMNTYPTFGSSGDTLSINASRKSLEIEGLFTEQLPMDGNIRYTLGQDLMSIGLLNSSVNEFKQDLKKNKFKISFLNETEFPYLHLGYTLEFKNHGIIPRTNLILRNNNFVLPSSGKLIITISNDTVLFKGDGAELMRCQYEMFSYYYSKQREILNANAEIKVAEKKILASGNNDSAYSNGLLKQDHIYDNIYLFQMDILERYRKEIGEELFLRLKYDLFGKKMSTTLKNLRYYFIIGNVALSSLLQEHLLQFYKDQFWFKKPDFKLDSIAKSSSYFYLKYLYEKSYSDLFIPLAVNGSAIRPSFEIIYNKLLIDYPKEVLNGILAGLFLNDFKGTPMWAYDDALKIVTDESLRDHIFNLKHSRSIGLPAFNFSLKDTNNNTVTLADLKGKILIFDFWYTGCLGCKGLALEMVPILEHYKGNEKVLFVSVSIDRDFEKWKASVRKEIYTHPETLNLYTNGLGEDAEMIKNFRVSSYPTLVIVDEEGKILSYNPSKPSKEIPARNSSFMNIINERLQIMK